MLNRSGGENMAEGEPPGEKAKAFFDGLWNRGDFWELESSPFEAAKYARQLKLVSDRGYGAVLEIGCGGGVFTRSLAPLADRLVALDVSPAAIDRARAGGTAEGVIDYRVANVMEYEPAGDGPFDLVVMSETIYYLGWLYTFFDVGWLAATLFDATAGGGRFLMTNTRGGLESYLHRPWLVNTYRDLFRNVGYRLDAEESFLGQKDGVRLEAMICLYSKPHGAAAVAV
jgi:SAM-dependent methyltransferase